MRVGGLTGCDDYYYMHLRCLDYYTEVCAGLSCVRLFGFIRLVIRSTTALRPQYTRYATDSGIHDDMENHINDIQSLSCWDARKG
jgi:hypothetical protein